MGPLVRIVGRHDRRQRAEPLEHGEVGDRREVGHPQRPARTLRGHRDAFEHDHGNGHDEGLQDQPAGRGRPVVGRLHDPAPIAQTPATAAGIDNAAMNGLHRRAVARRTLSVARNAHAVASGTTA